MVEHNLVMAEHKVGAWSWSNTKLKLNIGRNLVEHKMKSKHGRTKCRRKMVEHKVSSKNGRTLSHNIVELKEWAAHNL